MLALRKISLALLALALVAACSSQSPVVVAKSTEAKADALYGEYVIAEEAAAKLMVDVNVPDSVKQAIQDAHKAVTPVVEAMHEQRSVLGALRISKPEDVAGALLALDELITKVEPLVRTFSGRVGK